MVNMDTAELMNEFENVFKGKTLLTMDDIKNFLGCDEKTIINWTKRSDPKKRPPRMYIGNDVRFPRRPFLSWLFADQGWV